MMKLVACYLPSDRVWEKITNYAAIFGGNMRQLCEKQTGLCKEISTLDKIYNKTFQMY